MLLLIEVLQLPLPVPGVVHQNQIVRLFGVRSEQGGFRVFLRFLGVEKAPVL